MSETAPHDVKPASSRGRRLGMIAVLLGFGALAFWAASRMTWAELVAADGMTPPRTFTVKGADWAPALTPLAIVLLAGIAAAASLRGWALRITAFVVAAVAIIGILPALTLFTGHDDVSYAAKAIGLAGRYEALQVDTKILPGLLVIAGAVAAVLGAVVMLQTASRDAPMSSKYKSPAARRAELEKEVFAKRDAERRAADGSGHEAAAVAGPDRGSDTGSTGVDGNERLLWDALDTGDDPTIDPTDRER
ncbi:UNVERIFIED_CONTAM: putative membrane protein (TIGR02234 family) [Williamsia faeni]